MRHILIILISILLLSSFLTSCDKKEETLYRWGEYPEIVWIGDKETLPKYEGDVENGKPNGKGTFTWSEGKWKGDEYVGEYKNGKEHGQGTLTWSDGEKYVGEFKDGEMWNGTLYDKDGNIKYKWVNGVKQK